MDGEIRLAGLEKFDQEIRSRQSEIEQLERELSALTAQLNAVGEAFDNGDMGETDAERRAEQLAKKMASVAKLREKAEKAIDEQLRLADEMTERYERVVDWLEKGFGRPREAAWLEAAAMHPDSRQFRNAERSITQAPSLSPESAAGLTQRDRDSVARAHGQAERVTASPSVAGARAAMSNIHGSASAIERSAEMETDAARRATLFEAGSVMRLNEARMKYQMSAAAAYAPGRDFFENQLPNYVASVEGLHEGREGFTPSQLRAQGHRVEKSMKNWHKRIAGEYGEEAADHSINVARRYFDAAAPARQEAEHLYGSRDSLGRAEGLLGDYERYQKAAGRYRELGHGGIADHLEKKAGGMLGRLPDLLLGAQKSIDSLPEGVAGRQDLLGRLQNASVQHRRFDSEAEGRREDLLKERDRDKFMAGVDKKVERIDQHFAAMDAAGRAAAEYRAVPGMEHAAERTERGIYGDALRGREMTDAIHELIEALHQRGESEKADQLKDKTWMWEAKSLGAARRYNPDVADTFGEMFSGGLKRVPVVGNILHSLGGKALGEAVDNTAVGQFLSGAGANLTGRALSQKMATSPVAAQGAQMAGAARTAVGGFMASPPGWIAAGLALVGGTSMWAASKNMERGASARDEEKRFLELGNRLGTRDRILNDVRDTTTNALDPTLAKLRYGTEDYASFLDSANIASLHGEGRKRVALTGLQLGRAYGLGPDGAGAIASDLSRGRTAPADAAGMERDLVRMGQVLEQAVKNGMSSSEVTRAFSASLSQARSNAGGVLDDAQRGDLLEQALAFSQTKNAYLRGENGTNAANAIGNHIAGAEGSDAAFLMAAVAGKTGKQLGLSDAQAKDYDYLLGRDRYEAALYLGNNQTNEVRDLYGKRFIQSYGGSVSTLRSGFEAQGVEQGLAHQEALSIRRQIESGVKPEDVRSELLDRVSGKYDKSKLTDQPLRENQEGNNLGQTAQRQDLNAQEIKVRSSRVTFESVSGQLNVQAVQSVYLSGIGAGQAVNKAIGDNSNHGGSGKAKYNLGPVDGGKLIESRDVGVVPGEGARFDVAGVFHGGEAVINRDATARHRATLARINAGGSPGEDLTAVAGLLGEIRDELRGQRADTVAQRLAPDAARTPVSGGGLLGRLLGGELGGSQGGRGGFIGGLRAAWDRLTGGGGGATPEVTTQGGVGGFAQNAREALSASWAEDTAGYCSRFVRQTFERTFGRGAADGLFADEARQTGLAWQSRGLTMDPKKAGALRPGDVVFQMSGSGDYDGDGDDGHIGIIGPDGLVYENSTRGRGGKQATPLSQWGKIDLVGRLPQSAASPAVRPELTTGGGLTGFLNAVAAQESGHDYSARNSRTGALGKYQIMPQNLDGSWNGRAARKNFGWDFDALGFDITPQQLLANPQWQEKIARHQLSRAYGQYGAAGAARWWYSNSAAPSDKRPAANEPTPNEYASQVLARMGSGGGGLGGSGAATVRHVFEIRGNVAVAGNPSPALTAAVTTKVARDLLQSGARVVTPPRVVSPRTGA